MRILKIKHCIITGIFILGAIQTGIAQTGEVNIQQNKLIPELIELKSEMTRNGKLGERYNIQLFNGNNNTASEVIKEFRKNYEDWPSSMIYDTPNYKVLVGNFRNRLEADRALLKLKEEFPGAFIPKPTRG